MKNDQKYIFKPYSGGIISPEGLIIRIKDAEEKGRKEVHRRFRNARATQKEVLRSKVKQAQKKGLPLSEATVLDLLSSHLEEIDTIIKEEGR